MKKLLLFCRKYIPYIVISSLASIGCALASVWVIDILKRLVDESINGNIRGITQIAVEAVLAILIGMVSNYMVKYASEYFGAGMLSDMRKEAMNHLGKVAPDYMERNNFGDIVTRLTSDLGMISDYMETYFKDLLYLPFMIAVYAIYLFQTDWIMALVCLLPLMILIPLSIVLMKPVKFAQRAYTIKLGLTNNNIQEACDGIDVIKAYNLYDEVGGKYYQELHKTLDISNRNDIRQYNLEPISQMISEFPVILGLCLGGYFVFEGRVTLGVLVAFVSLIKKLIDPLKRVYQLIVKGQMAMICVDRVMHVIDAPPEYIDDTNTSYPKEQCDDIFALEHVSFAYAGMAEQKNVLNDINLTIRRGTKVALVGRSGGGKSTILKLLYRHYAVTDGVIRHCGVSYEQIHPEHLRSDIALISQDSYLFPMSIEENIRIGNPEATHEQIVQAAKLANCHDFIKQMPEQYASMVGEKGGLVSGGQRQRISIARAILKNASVILLDEPTSALDRESEEKVNEAIHRISEGRTVVTVAHRLTTITDADEIIVVDGGQIVERGKHEELLKKQGLYAELFREYMEGGAQNEA